MDKVLCLLLNDDQFEGPYGFSSRWYISLRTRIQVGKEDLEQAEQAADKLENWLNGLSL